MNLPPLSLTYDEYSHVWARKGWKLIVIGPTSTWRESWGPWEAIRDFVQNALDESESYSWYHDSEGLVISDPGAGIKIADLLLGPPKLKSADARGRFGEGMKIAALTFLRMGNQVYIETANRLIAMVFIAQPTDAEPVMSLAALWQPAEGGKPGTRIHVVNYFGDSFDSRFTINLSPSSVLHKGVAGLKSKIVRHNSILNIGKQPGHQTIFVRDIMMDADFASLYSYNLWDVTLAPDRYAAEKESMIPDAMARAWITVDKQWLIEDLFKQCKVEPGIARGYFTEFEAMDLSGYSLGYDRNSVSYRYYIQVTNKHLWQAAFKAVFGQKAVMLTESKHRTPIEHLGYTPIELPYNMSYGLKRVIKTDVEVIFENAKRMTKAKIIPETKLTPLQRANLAVARSLARCAGYKMPAGVNAAILPPSESGSRISGMYDKTTKIVYLSAESLSDLEETIDVSIHEFAHHYSYGAEDGTEEHAKYISNVGAKIIKTLQTNPTDLFTLIKESNRISRMGI